MMNGVMGFQIAVTRVEAAAKLSQNRSAPDRQRIIDELSAAGSPGSLDIAREMERRKGQLPPGKG
jgi:transcriptional regulator